MSRVQIPDDTVCISFHDNAIGKGIHLSLHLYITPTLPTDK